MLKLDLQSRIPIYEQLKSKISELVMVDIMQSNEQLPSVRSLARELGVNPNTVQKAYQELEREGVIYSVTGKGSFVAQGNDPKKKMEMQYIARVKNLITEVKNNGIAMDNVIHTVKMVYEEDIK